MEENTARNKKKTTFKTEIYDWIQCLVTALVACILIFMFLGQVIGVEGHSMVPTLQDQDKVIISNLFYTPKKGDVVVLTKRAFKDVPIVKRVIATEGQTVDIDFDEGKVWVDGVLQEEEYVNSPTNRFYDLTFPLTVDEGCVFVMGDNRNESTDSRYSVIGCVDTRCILGRVYAVILPFSRLGTVS